MGMEEGLNKLVREMKKEKNTDVLRKKIREMILAEMNDVDLYDPLAEAKKDEEEEEDIDIDVTDEKMIGNDDPKVIEIQDLLDQLKNAAKGLDNDENGKKLKTQIDNTIIFFTGAYIATADDIE
jgi:hypothetical protein